MLNGVTLYCLDEILLLNPLTLHCLDKIFFANAVTLYCLNRVLLLNALPMIRFFLKMRHTNKIHNVVNSGGEFIPYLCSE